MKKAFEKELDDLQASEILTPEYRKKKMMMWIIRTTIAVVLYLLFWKYQWVRWSLWIYVPISLLSLFAIVGSSYFLKKKLEKTRQKMAAFDGLGREEEE